MDAFGCVHALAANAGTLCNGSLVSMSEQDWDVAMAVHLQGTFKVRSLAHVECQDVY